MSRLLVVILFKLIATSTLENNILAMLMNSKIIPILPRTWKKKSHGIS
jgi:hypothetical protein